MKRCKITAQNGLETINSVFINVRPTLTVLSCCHVWVCLGTVPLCVDMNYLVCVMFFWTEVGNWSPNSFAEISVRPCEVCVTLGWVLPTPALALAPSAPTQLAATPAPPSPAAVAIGAAPSAPLPPPPTQNDNYVVSPNLSDQFPQCSSKLTLTPRWQWLKPMQNSRHARFWFGLDGLFSVIRVILTWPVMAWPGQPDRDVALSNGSSEHLHDRTSRMWSRQIIRWSHTQIHQTITYACHSCVSRTKSHQIDLLLLF